MNRNGDDSDSSDEGLNYVSSSFLTSRHYNRQRIPRPPDSPDTSVLDQSKGIFWFLNEESFVIVG